MEKDSEKTKEIIKKLILKNGLNAREFRYLKKFPDEFKKLKFKKRTFKNT